VPGSTDPFAIFATPGDAFAVFRRHPGSPGVDPTEGDDEEARRRKRAQMAQARQIAAAQGLAGPDPQQSVGARALAFGDRAVSAAAEGLVSIPELAAKFLPDDNPSAMLPSQDTEREVPGDPYPTLGKPGGFFDLKASREDIRRQNEQHREALAASEGDPAVIAAADTLAEAAGMALPLGPGGKAARAAEEAQGALRMTLGRAAPVARAAEELAPEEAAFLARRAKAMASMPGGDAAFVGPGAVADSFRPESALLQVGEHTERAAQDAALGLRGAPGSADELARASLAIDEHAAPAPLPRREPPSLAEIFGERREELPADTPHTGTKNAVAEPERIARGLPQVEALARKTSGETWGEAKRIFETDPEAPRALAARVAEKPRALTPLENDLLLHDRMKISLDHREALAAEEAAFRAGDAEAAELAKIRRVAAEAAIDVNDTALKRAGTEWALAGSARQKLIAEDFSPLYLRQRLNVAAREAGAPVLPGAEEKLTQLSRQIEEAHGQLAGYEERVAQLEAERAVASVHRDVAKAERSGIRRAAKVDLDAEFQELAKRLDKKAVQNQQTLNMSGGLDPETVGIISRMAKNRVQAGARGLGEVVDSVFQTIRPHIEGLEPREVRDAISGYGVVRQQATRSEAVQELARIRQEGRTLAALDEARAAGRTAEAAQLERKAQQIAERHALPGRGPSSPAEQLAAARNRLARREKELTMQLAEGYHPKVKRRPVALDSDAIALQGRVNALKRQANLVIRKQELAGRTRPEVAMDWTASWGRFLKLSGTATLQKISAAASERALLFKPLEEFLGTGVSRLPVVKHFAAEAPIEGGGSLKAIAKSYAGFFGKTARAELRAGLAGREGAFSEAFSKHASSAAAPEWMEYPGRVHAGLKAPAKIAAYEFAMEKQALYYLKKEGPDALLNPVLQEEMKARSYEYALRDIFMGENAAVRSFRRAFEDRPGQSLAMKATNTTANVLLPIVKVPTNYALEVTDYAVGLVKAGAKVQRVVRRGFAKLPEGTERTLANAIKEGLKHVPEGQAELIMRQIKKGSLGAGLIALGATGAVEVGGYYVPGEHRRHSDLHPGEIRIGGHGTGVTIPHNLLHHPAVEAIQVGGTVHRARSVAEGLVNAGWGVAEQVPFLPSNSIRDIREDPSRILGNIGRGMTIPPDAQRLARVLDQKHEQSPAAMTGQQFGFGGLEIGPLGIHVPELEARKRKARGSFWEQLVEEEMLGVPGLRDDVR